MVATNQVVLAMVTPSPCAQRFQVDADVRLSRRIRRDMESRGRSLDGVLQQYERFVKPSTEQFVVPTKRYADIIIPRGVENTVGVDMIAQHINGVLMQRELRSEAILRADRGNVLDDDREQSASR